MVVEDHPSLKRLLTRYLESSNISYIFASSVEDALSLFHHNVGEITHIALDGNLGDFSDVPDTLCLAQLIGKSVDFHGVVFPTSSHPEHNESLQKAIGDRCQILPFGSAMLKFRVIQHIINLIKPEQ